MPLGASIFEERKWTCSNIYVATFLLLSKVINTISGFSTLSFPYIISP